MTFVLPLRASGVIHRMARTLIWCLTVDTALTFLFSLSTGTLLEGAANALVLMVAVWVVALVAVLTVMLFNRLIMNECFPQGAGQVFTAQKATIVTVATAMHFTLLWALLALAHIQF